MAELKAALVNLLQRHQEIKANPDISWPQRWPVETQVSKPLLVASHDGRRVSVATFKDEAGQAERKALVGRMNVVMHSADAAFKDGDVSLQGTLAEIEGLMNVRVVRYGTSESELAPAPVSEPEGKVVERARKAEPDLTPKSDMKPEPEQNPEPFVAAEKPKINLINRGPDGRMVVPESDTANVTQASPSSDLPPTVEQEIVVDEAALNDYLQQAVLNIERTLDGIATMREGLERAGAAEACGDSFSKKVLIGAVYVMRTNFPDVISNDGVIDASKLPIQGNKDLLNVIERYNAEKAAMAQRPALEDLEAACEAGDSRLRHNNAPIFPANS